MTFLLASSIVTLSCSREAGISNKPTIDKRSQEDRDLKEIITRYFESISQNEQRDPVLLAKKINSFVYTFCSSEKPHTASMDKLLKHCHTTCSGYVYLFSKIAAYFGIQTRVIYLFNIPIQGNHTMVEVRHSGDKWALFDPTFGTFFTSRGEPTEIPYSLDEIYFTCTPNTLSNHVVQARVINPVDLSAPLDALYSARSFSSPHMNLPAYILAESYGYLDPLLYSLSWMNIDMQKDPFQFGGPANNLQEGENRFLIETNALLNDHLAGNEISYNISYLGKVGEHTYKNGYRLSHLAKGDIYRITLYGINPSGVSLYPHFTDSRAILQHSGRQSVPKGVYTHSFLFRAQDTSAELVLEVYPKPSASMRIFGIRIESYRTLN